MKRIKIFSVLLICFLLSSCIKSSSLPGGAPTAAVNAQTGEKGTAVSEEDARGKGYATALFLGIADYGNTEVIKLSNAENFRYRFIIDGQEQSFSIGIGPENEPYQLQNRLKEGYLFKISAENGVISDLYEVSDADENIISGKVKKAENGVITVSRREVTNQNDAPVLRVSRLPGGAEVQAAQVTEGDYVSVEIDEKGSLRAGFILPEPHKYKPPVKGKAGVRTLKNYLATALMPVGICNYIFGGGWDWQDEGSGIQSRTIGLPDTWVDFFLSNDENFTYRDPYGNSSLRDASKSYCPFGGWNEYYYAGLDCSGYLAWVTYNTLHSQDGLDGYVVGGTPTASSFASYGWGTFTQEVSPSDFRPGDIMSINGHVWICLGKCGDGSLVIVHSSPTSSKTGSPGGGVQLSAIGDSASCEAYALLNEYMNIFYPEWINRYDIALFSFSYYTSFTGNVAGRFSWDLDGENGVLTDPDGFAQMSAAEIMAELFGYVPLSAEDGNV